MWRQTKTTEKVSDGSYVISRYQSADRYHDAFQAIENESVKKYGGFFIGRYEAGDKESTEAKSMRTMSSPENNKVTIKKGQAPYNYITQQNSVILAEGMSTVNNYTKDVITKLCSSYSWDTALKFIENTYPKYSTESKNKSGALVGNYYNVALDYIDISGNHLTRSSQTSSENCDIIPTGQTEAICNIYDMGGNLVEYTTEVTDLSQAPYSVRGGNIVARSDDQPAAMRNGLNITASPKFKICTLRLTLFIK